jgi:hypothetical protein
MEETKLKIIIDQVGRIIIGEQVDLTDERLVLKNPCNIFIQPNEHGQLQVQTIPLFFREFLTQAGREAGVSFEYKTGQYNATTAGDHLDEKLVNQYYQVMENFKQQDPVVQPAEPAPGEVVQLFNE